MVELFPTVEEICANLSQLKWALNSNREHVRYVCKVFNIPDLYYRHRLNINTGQWIPIKANIIEMNQICSTIINECEMIRINIHHLVKEIYFH